MQDYSLLKTRQACYDKTCLGRQFLINIKIVPTTVPTTVKPGAKGVADGGWSGGEG